MGVVEGVDEELRGIYEELGDWLKASVCIFCLLVCIPSLHGHIPSVYVLAMCGISLLFQYITVHACFIHRLQAQLLMCCLATVTPPMPCTCAARKSGRSRWAGWTAV